MIRYTSRSVRREFLFVVVLVLIATTAYAQEPSTKESDIRDIGARRELFVDRFLIDRLENATLKLHEPTFSS